jgi:seryl-tRNA(Sec) selenium transferase
MTTLTDNGLEGIADLLIGNISGGVDALAVGTGQNESTTATSLGNEVFRATPADSNVDLIDSDSGEAELAIRVKGGQEVSAGTTISETAVIINNDISIIDEFSDVIIETGHVEEFTVPVSILRSN